MRRVHALTLMLLLLAVAAAPALAQTPAASDNPLLKEWTTPFGVPPFAEIKPAHFLPAFELAVADERRDIDAIVNNPQPPTFANTIEAYENAGRLLSKVNPVFSNLSSAETNAELQAINKKITPMLSALRDDIGLNDKLFARVKAVWQQRDQLKLTPEQRKLLDDTFKGFVRGGANLNAQQKERLRAVNGELAMLGLKFSESLLRETNSYRLVIDKQEDLAGLPPAVVAGGADAAKAAGMPGKWLFNLQAPSIWPFLQYADNRELRRQILEAYASRCDHGDEHDTNEVLSKTAALRAEKAQLLGYKTHADFVLEENMAKTPAAVYGLLNQLWTPARAKALQEARDLQDMIKKEGGAFQLAPWDWRYYAEKVKKARYDLDEQAVRPYFQIDKVREGAFYVANKLYGITFTPRPDIPVYHPEVKAFEVKDADGSHLGVFLTDYHPRPGKRVGAWSSRYRGTRVENGTSIRPIVVNVCNFSRPAGDQPALLSLEEVSTLFHEFGHGLHSLLSKVPYAGLGGVPRDFVEVPSQIMEHWALEPEVLRVYATHHKTGEVIPAPMVQKIEAADKFNQGFITVEYLAASILDMDWHTLTATEPQEAGAFEKRSLEKMQMLSEIIVRYRSPYFSHIFGPGGGYASGYYAYIWSEVLDTDAFEAFKEKGLFDQATAKSFRTNILERGGSEEAMTLYKRFRGREPSVEPLLVKRGLK